MPYLFTNLTRWCSWATTPENMKAIREREAKMLVENIMIVCVCERMKCDLVNAKRVGGFSTPFILCLSLTMGSTGRW